MGCHCGLPSHFWSQCFGGAAPTRNGRLASARGGQPRCCSRCQRRTRAATYQRKHKGLEGSDCLASNYCGEALHSKGLRNWLRSYEEHRAWNEIARSYGGWLGSGSESLAAQDIVFKMVGFSYKECGMPCKVSESSD